MHLYSLFWQCLSNTEPDFYFSYSFLPGYDIREIIIVCISQLFVKKVDDCLELHKLQMFCTFLAVNLFQGSAAPINSSFTT